MRWTLPALLCLLLLGALGCGGNGGPSGIFGTAIHKSTRRPVANAQVVLLRGEVPFAEVVTDSSGKFSFPNLPADSYTLVVTADGFIESRVGVTLTAGARRTVTVELVPQEEGPPTDVPITD